MGDVSFKVSEAIEVINQVHEQAFPFIIVEGEVSSFKVNQSKFVFFDIKDSQASLSCFMMLFALKFPLEDGMKVRVVAQPKLTKWGKFSLTVREVIPVGEGSLKKAYKLLKTKLQSEGLFDVSRKRTIPAIPQRIAVISSSQAAGYGDFIKILENRWGGLEIVLYDITIQGAKAPSDIVGALSSVNSSEEPFDVVTIVRGGGSADDLSVFNHEDVVRAVATSRTATLLGVGHEVDSSLADLAADVRAATPSNAAEILVPDKQEVISKTRSTRALIQEAQQSILGGLSERNLETSELIYKCAMESLQSRRRTAQVVRRGLEQLNPQRALQRGYAVVRAEGSVLASVAHATIGKAITVQLSDGEIGAKITDV